MGEEVELQTREETRQRNQRKAESARARAEDDRRRGREQQQRLDDLLRRRGRLSLWARYAPYTAYVLLAVATLFILLNSFSGDRRKLSQIPVNDDVHFIRHNESQRPYALGRNSFFEGVTLDQARALAANEITAEKSVARCNAPGGAILRESFNFYEQHPQCRFAETQRRCAGSYVEAPLSVLRNRHCLRNGGADFRPSVDFALACHPAPSRGCDGGQVIPAVAAMAGGVPAHECWAARVGAAPPGACPRERLEGCERVALDAHCMLEGEEEIKREVQLNGPVVSVLLAHRDLLSYKSGVFDPAEQQRLGGMFAVKIVGWETNAQGESAWLVDPLWGDDWGERGLARVAMGAADSLIEKFAYTLYPAAARAAAAEPAAAEQPEPLGEEAG